MTTAQLHILQHSLGLDEFGEGRQFRNHYVAGESDLVTCRALSQNGYMREHPASVLSGGDPVFTVTTEGKQAVQEHSPKRPKLSRARRRYLHWLEVSDVRDISFSTYLKQRAYRQAVEE